MTQENKPTDQSGLSKPQITQWEQNHNLQREIINHKLLLTKFLTDNIHFGNEPECVLAFYQG